LPGAILGKCPLKRICPVISCEKLDSSAVPKRAGDDRAVPCSAAARIKPREISATRSAAIALLSVLTAVLCCAPRPAHATCFSDLLGGNAPFEDQIERDPKAAIALIEAELSKTTMGPGTGFSRAHLYAMLMDAYQNAGDIAAARGAAALGMESLTTADSSGLQHRLQLTGIMLLEVQGQIQRAVAEYEPAAASVPDDAPDLVCVLGDRGYLRYLVGRKIDAAVDALRAYRLAKSLDRDEIRLSAGQLLARLYSQYGLYDEALALAGEAVAFYARSPKKELLSDAYLFRGDVFLEQEDYAAAGADFLKSRALLESIGDRFAQSFTQQRLCQVAARMGHRSDAPAVCSDAYELAEAVKNPISAKFVLTALGQIEFGEGHAREAVDLWDRALAEDGVDLPKHTRSSIYSARGRARAQLGDPVGALRDTNLYVKSLEDDRQARGADQLALLKVMFDTTLKGEELARVRAETRAAELATSRQAFIRNLVAASAIFAVAAVPLGMWSWHRRKLAVESGKAAEQRLAAIGRLTGGIAHDFNNLLGVLQQAIGMLEHRESVAGDAAAIDLVRQARQANQICADITSQLLSFSRQQNLQPEVVEMDRYLSDVQSLLERAAGTAVKLQVEMQEPRPVAWVDRRQLTAALLNLVANARDAMSSGGTLTVRASAEVDQRVRIDVIDKGCGMLPEVLTRATEPFYSTKAVGHGTGLGLSMVQGFATQSGGTLAIASEPNRGTTVSLWLPAAAAAA
jgi:signal transduction histidine kinase